MPSAGSDRQVSSYAVYGFWAPMDTLKERMALEEMHRSANRPWAVWEEKHGLGGSCQSLSILTLPMTARDLS
jgi:glucose-1-phosphate cytidylyltransferase